MDLSPENVVVPEHNKGQGAARENRLNVFLINGAVFRGDHCAGKENGRQRIRRGAGQLSNCVEHILVDEDTVPRFQNGMDLSHLVVQNTALRCGNLEVGMPVHRARAVWQSGKFIAVKCDGKR